MQNVTSVKCGNSLVSDILIAYIEIFHNWELKKKKALIA